MLLELTHETVFEYSEPVSEIFVEFRQTPLTDNSQHLLQHRQRVTPSRPVRQYADAFGNTVSYFNITDPQEKIEVSFDTVVETFPTAYRGQPLTDSLDSPAARTLLYDYLRPTPLTVWGEEFLLFVRAMEKLRGASLGEISTVVRDTVHGSFRYEGEVTNASSPITDMLRLGCGVCQDFAHVMIAVCRYLGVPARYVSGYVLPDDNSDVAASHAWCELFDPEKGWLGIDPTHRQTTGDRYVCLGVGRDYRDVPPNRGVYRGAAIEKLKVNVTLKPISPDDLMARARALYPQPRNGAMTRGPRKPSFAPVSLQTLAQQQSQQQQ